MLFPLLSLTSLATSSPASVAEKKNDWIIHDQDIVVNYITPLSWGVYLSGTFWERWVQVITYLQQAFCPYRDIPFSCVYRLSTYRVLSLTWPVSMQIYWNKRKRFHNKRIQIPQDWFGTLTWPPFHCFLGHQYGRRNVKWKHSIFPWVHSVASSDGKYFFGVWLFSKDVSNLLYLLNDQ